jgi:TPR repeat protein
MSRSLILMLAFGLPCMAVQAQTVPQLREKALAGDPKAMVALAEKFQFGDGVTANADSSAYWIEAAAKTGDNNATYLLGIQKCSQIYSAKSFTQGMAFLNQSADSGNTAALMKLHEIWTDKSTDDESAKYNSATKGFAYLKRAADLGLPAAMYMTGEAYCNARGVAKSDSLALQWHQLNADRNQHIGSRLRLADFHFEGRAMSQPDYWKALELFKGVRYDPLSGTDSRATAEVGIHKVDQVLKRAHLLHMQGQLMLPTATFDYRLRQ